MGLFDSNSSSTTLNQTTNIKHDQVIGNGSIGLATEGNNNQTTVQVLDGGAVAGAFELARANYDSLMQTTSQTLNGVLSGIASTQNFIAATQAQASGSLDNRTKLLLGLGAIVLFGVVSLGRK